MSEQCQRCSAQSLHAFLCRTCTTELRELLVGLGDHTVLTNPLTGETAYGPPWLESLQDAAWGATRLGISVRHSTDPHGPLPFQERACDLLEQATQLLQRWVSEINLNNETLGEQ